MTGYGNLFTPVGKLSGTTYLVRNWIPGVVKIRFWIEFKDF